MAELHVSAERIIPVPPARVYGILADYAEQHPRILPPAFQDLQVEEGGVGAGTLVHVTLTAGGRRREYRMRVDEPEPGRVLRESDQNSSLVTTFTVVPEGAGSRVTIATRWQGAKGFGGFMERTFAPRVMRKLYQQELELLDRYARSQQG